MKTIIIKKMNDKNTNKIKFISVLVNGNPTTGLKAAKDLVDSLAQKGIPIEFQVEDNKFANFTQELDNLNLEYTAL